MGIDVLRSSASYDDRLGASHMDPRTEHLLYRVFKRNIGTTVTIAVVLTGVAYFFAPAVAIGLGIATALLLGWWILFIING